MASAPVWLAVSVANPADPKVQPFGPQLYLEIQVDGTGVFKDHVPIDPGSLG